MHFVHLVNKQDGHVDGPELENRDVEDQVNSCFSCYKLLCISSEHTHQVDRDENGGEGAAANVPLFYSRTLLTGLFLLKNVSQNLNVVNRPTNPPLWTRFLSVWPKPGQAKWSSLLCLLRQGMQSTVMWTQIQYHSFWKSISISDTNTTKYVCRFAVSYTSKATSNDEEPVVDQSSVPSLEAHRMRDGNLHPIQVI